MLDLKPKEDVVDFIQQLKTVGTEDINGALHDALNKAKPKSIASGIAERIESVIDGRICAIDLPWPGVARVTKALLPGTVTLLCGSPGASKSFMLLQALAFWLANDVKASVFELEEDCDYHITRALAQRAGIAGLTDDEWVRNHAEEARQALTKHADFLNVFGRCIHASPETQPTLEQLAAWVRERAKAGDRVIAIDPVTAARRTGDPWNVDNSFLSEVKRTAVDHGCSIAMITHPTKAMTFPDMNQLAGSAAYARLAQAIVWLESHDDKESRVWMGVDTTELSHNRTLHILKARNGRGMGLKLAFQFESENLMLKELGLIMKKDKGKQ